RFVLARGPGNNLLRSRFDGAQISAHVCWDPELGAIGAFFLSTLGLEKKDGVKVEGRSISITPIRCSPSCSPTTRSTIRRSANRNRARTIPARANSSRTTRQASVLTAWTSCSEDNLHPLGVMTSRATNTGTLKTSGQTNPRARLHQGDADLCTGGATAYSRFIPPGGPSRP